MDRARQVSAARRGKVKNIITQTTNIIHSSRIIRNMKRHYAWILVALLTWTVGAADAITRQQLATYATSLKGKKKAELKTALYQLMNSGKQTLSYGSGSAGTWWGFYVTDRDPNTNEVINRYSSGKYYFGKRGNAVTGMNIEHSFPKSWWGGSKNAAYQDLYELYPSPSDVNGDKSNYPMDAVSNATAEEDGYDKVGTATHVSGKAWEPGDRYKGDFARGYMYMAVTYSNLTYQKTGLLTMQADASGYPGMLQWATDLYRAWSGQDKADSLEVARNNAVASIQNNRNLFVDYPYLCEYVWGDSVNVAFDPDNAITTASDDSRYGTFTPTPPTPDDSTHVEGSYVFSKLEQGLPTAGKRYLIVAQSAAKLYAAKPVALSSGKTYGYLYTDGVMDENGKVTLSEDNDAYTFEEADGGYYLKDSQGRYYYQDQSYNTFTPTTSLSDADVWVVTANGDGTYTIKASDSGNVIMYSAKYKSYGNYGTDKQADNIFPFLYEEQRQTDGIGNPAVGRIPDTAVYTLQGVRVSKATQPGVYIRGGRKFVVK